MAPAVGTSQSCLFWGCQKYDNNIELCSVANIACVKWKATNIALGQYWFLLLLHGFIPSGPGQYGVLLPWLDEDMTKYIMSVLYPPIQEEMVIRRNIAISTWIGGYNTDPLLLTNPLDPCWKILARWRRGVPIQRVRHSLRAGWCFSSLLLFLSLHVNND